MADRPAGITGIRRPSRLGAVWLSYRTRWLMWILVAGVGFQFVAVGWSIWADHFRSIYAPNWRGLKSAEPDAPFPSPSAWVGFGADAVKPDWANLRSLNVTDVDHCEPLWTPGAIPRLQSLTLFGPISDKRLALLCTLYDLKSLTLYDAHALTADGLRRWKNETGLEYLRVLNLAVAHEASSLDWPPNLQTLVCVDHHGIPLQRLNEWRQLPHLKCLSTRLVPRENGFSAEMLDSLRSFPGLTRLFVQELGPHFPDLVSSLQSELPMLRVRPSSFDPYRVQRAATILLCGLLVVVVLSLQVSSQFVTSASLLTPHFARSHIRPVAAASIVLACLSCGQYLLADCSILVSIAMCGASVFLLASEARLFRLMQSTSAYQMPGFVNPVILIPIIVFPVIGLQFLLNLCGSEFDWFLRGQHSWLAAMLLVGSFWGAFDLVQWHIGLLRELEESGGGNVPLSLFDIGGWANWGKSIAAAREGEGTKSRFAERRYDGRMERYFERMPSGKRANPSELWRLASVDAMFDWLKVFVALSIALGVLGAWLVPETFWQFGPYAAYAGFQILGMGLIIPLMFAWMRRPMQEMELLRPVTRSDWVRTWFQGVAAEIAPVQFVTMAFGAVMLWSGFLGVWTVTDACAAAVIFVGVVGAIFAVGMWTLTLRSLWLILLVGGMAYVALVFCIVTPIVIQMQKAEWQTPIILIPAIVGLYAAAFAGLWIAWRSWMNWEVGRVA